MADNSQNLYDNRGTAEGGLQTANDIGVNLFDNRGDCSGMIYPSGTPPATTTPLRTLMGCGV